MKAGKKNMEQAVTGNHGSPVVACADGIIIDANPEFIMLSGYPLDELRGMKLELLLKPATDEKKPGAGKISRRSGPGRASLRKKSREETGVIVSSLTEGTGLPSFEILSVRAGHSAGDNRLKKTGLPENGEEYRYLVENMNDIIFSLDAGGGITYASPNFETLLGYGPDDVYGNNFLKFIHPGDAGRVSSNFDRVMSGETLSNEYRLVKKNGDILWIRTLTKPLYHEGMITGSQGILSDITSRKNAESALMISEERYRLLFEQSPVGIFMYDTGLIIQDCNDKFAAILLSSRERLIRLDMKTLKDERIRPCLTDAINGGTGRYEGSYLATTSSAKIYISMMTSPVYGGTGSITGGIGIVEDITEKMKADELLSKERTTLNNIIQINPYPIAILDENGFVSRVNQSFKKLFAAAPKQSFSLFDDLDGIQDDVLKLKRGEAVYLPDIKYVRPAEMNAGIHLEITAFPLKNPEGFFDSFVVMFNDITARKAAESELIREKELLAVTMKSITDGVITLDPDGGIVLMNRAAETITGWSLEEAAGIKFDRAYMTLGPAGGKPADSEAKRVLESRGGEIHSAEKIVISRDGTERFVSESASPIYDLSGAFMGAVLVFSDITERHRMELELQKNQRLESIGLLAGGIAHDFNNILAAIVGNISLARLMVPGEERVSMILKEAEKAVFRARDLTQQLLTFSRGGMPVKQLSELKGLIGESVNFILRGSRSTCNFFLPDDLWGVELDTGQMGQVIQNIVINADQAMTDGGVITIEAENIMIENGALPALAPGKYVRVTISDQGGGIPQEYLQYVFDPYFTTKKTGSGLGLSIAHSIIKKHGGSITVDSEPGKGTSFRIYLPATEKTAEKKGEELVDLEGISAKVLIMDDDAGIRDYSVDLLKNLGMEAYAARDGSEAARMFREEMDGGKPFDLVIVDLTVPGGMGGLETLQTIRRMMPGVKAIVSSGYSNDAVMAEYEKHGFMGMITKPYGLDELKKTIKAVLTGSCSR